MKRAIRIGIVTAWPDEDWHSERLLAACGRRADAVTIDPASLAARVGSAGVEVRAGGERASRFDAFVLARGLGRAGDPDVQFEIYRALEAGGAIVVNRLEPLLAAQDKFRTSWLLRRAGVPTPRAAVAQTPADAEAALGELGEAVLKLPAGSLGEGVVRLGPGPASRRALRERIARRGAVYLQAYVPNPGRDLRVFVVGGRTRAAISREASPGEWRTNVARGGRAEAAAPGPSAMRAAERAAGALGLDYAGVDLVAGADGPTVLEVNGNPSWRGILEATGLDMGEAIAEHVLGLVLRRQESGGQVRRERSTGAIHG